MPALSTKTWQGTSVASKLHTQHRPSRPSESSKTSHKLQPICGRGFSEKACYRRNVGICLVNKDGLVFAARRLKDTQNSWQMPQGGIDSGEGDLAAAKRELAEETGITSARVVYVMESWLSYDFPTFVRDRLSGSIREYRGQTQRWVLMHFHGSEEEIDLEASREREFRDYRWMPLEDLPAKIVPFKSKVYQAVHEEFGPIIQQRLAAGRLEDAWWGIAK